MRGHYPAFAKKEMGAGNTAPVMEPRDEQILAEGVCDYLGFSYYMTNAVKADVQKDTTESLDGSSANSVPNPYVKQVTGDGRSISGLRYALVSLYERYENHCLLWKMDLGNRCSKEDKPVMMITGSNI